MAKEAVANPQFVDQTWTIIHSLVNKHGFPLYLLRKNEITSLV